MRIIFHKDGTKTVINSIGHARSQEQSPENERRGVDQEIRSKLGTETEFAGTFRTDDVKLR